MSNPATPEIRAELRRIATDGWTSRPNHILGVLDALDDAECEIERQRCELVIERRRAEAAEAALKQAQEELRRVCVQRDDQYDRRRIAETFHEHADGALKRVRKLTQQRDGKLLPLAYRVSVEKVLAALDGEA